MDNLHKATRELVSASPDSGNGQSACSEGNAPFAPGLHKDPRLPAPASSGSCWEAGGLRAAGTFTLDGALSLCHLAG
jgi:hypothetical protein